ncbi:hypothetical protein Gohar_024930, partial [Gossypium harknessii]|nr:hypothetical protein [Gossypium harknessii]
MNSVINYLIRGKGEWKRLPNTNLSLSFNQAISPDHVVCIGMWIYKSMIRCISGQMVGIFFLHLMMALCKKAKLPMAATKQFLKLTRSLIRDPIV